MYFVQFKYNVLIIPSTIILRSPESFEDKRLWFDADQIIQTFSILYCNYYTRTFKYIHRAHIFYGVLKLIGLEDKY